MSGQLLEATVMVESLRVAELRSLLTTMGKDKKGLKKDLVQRVIELLHNNFRPELFSAIRELYDRRHCGSNANRRRYQVITMPTTVEVVAVYPKKSCGSPVHIPEVHMIKLPFYQTLETVVAPVSLVPSYAIKQQISRLTFCLTTRQSAQIMNCQRANTGVASVQVVLRSCYTESIGVEDDQYPPNIAVLINGHDCPVQAHYSSNKKGLEPSHPCRPINLTPFVKQATENHVAVSWENYGKFYSAAIYLVKVFSSADLLAQLQKNGVASVELCKQKVCEKLRCNPENEITTTGLQVSLICPLSKMRMSTPCRAQTCAHLQCFDAAFYLQMNERKPRWTCPVCHKPALFDTLQIDGLLSGILQCAHEAVKEIEYLSNGSWSAVGKEKECSKTTDLSSLSHKNDFVVRDVVDLTECSTDSDDGGGAMQAEEIVLTHVKNERVSFSKGNMHVKR
ncbi:E3 SUMO-protein ligase PIAS4b isoform X1 [Tachysurus fulvidraco]|uniref:E3 SUMO-protein ligase PIAS4b isoform X1 n=1 Tax=Tachysurus fulvidraco TaxID=1234273 RepID=UPI000F4F2B03|nr:E3 SUMO-protein ligase PIAS4b isoform X1 [Tachysurus fulvidraco]